MMFQGLILNGKDHRIFEFYVFQYNQEFFESWIYQQILHIHFFCSLTLTSKKKKRIVLAYVFISISICYSKSLKTKFKWLYSWCSCRLSSKENKRCMWIVDKSGYVLLVSDYNITCLFWKFLKNENIVNDFVLK